MITYQTLNKIMEKLPADVFVRIHKSFIVSVKKIDMIDGNMVNISGKNLPIGRLYRQELINKLNNSL